MLWQIREDKGGSGTKRFRWVAIAVVDEGGEWEGSKCRDGQRLLWEMREVDGRCCVLVKLDCLKQNEGIRVTNGKMGLKSA